MIEIRLSPELFDDTVVLRQWTAADYEFYAGYLGDQNTAQYIGGPVGPQQAWRHLASMIGHWTLRGFGVYAAADRASHQLLGCAGLWQPQGWPCREFVFWFTADAYHRGRALEAAQLAHAHVHATLPDDSLTSFIHPRNASALALACALGGTLRGEEPLFDFGPHQRVSYPSFNAQFHRATTVPIKE